MERVFRWPDERLIEINNKATIACVLTSASSEDEAVRHLELANGMFSAVDREVESPVEALFAYAFVCTEVVNDRRDPIQFQKKIGKYRVDVLVGKSLVVEVDGHDFHERTKEQAQRDKARDRFLVAHKYRVLRFTGSEVYRRPFACAWEVFSQVTRIRKAFVDLSALDRPS